MYSLHMRPPRFVRFEDTSPEAEAVLIALYRKMSPEKKMRQVAALNRTVKLLALSRLKQEDPEARVGGLVERRGGVVGVVCLAQRRRDAEAQTREEATWLALGGL